MRKGFTVFAAVAASLVATPLVVSATNALATAQSEAGLALPAAVTPVEVVAVPPPASAPACDRKVRVVYSGYGAASACTAAVR